MDLSLLPLAFSIILTIVSRLIHPYSTDDKTSRLMVEKFSTVRDTQRVSELHGEEKREEVDRGDQEEKRGIKMGESNLDNNQFPICSPQSGTLREFCGVTYRKEEGRG